MRRIEHFIAHFVRNAQSRSPRSMTLGAPRSRMRGASVQWPFPARHADRVQHWAQFLRVLSYMHTAVRSDAILSKREIYYRDPSLFGSQRTVDSMIARACMTLNLSRAALSVCATPRSVVWGPIGFGGQAQLAEQTIPDPAHVSSLVSSAEWIVIVEKHAVYQTLRTIDFLGQVGGHLPPGAVVTGKGYPDHATRWMLGELARHASSTHLLFLVDSDPHGVDIFRTYQDALPSSAQVHWSGLRARQWLRLQMAHAIPTMPLTRADRAKAKSML
ncbi:endodeoxyribonuclease [Malassezia japonica]|uniref:DNA topoisomerase (ATP-hydrolyzing) n=1 Tax=Malassezia japonica TaxID=223818 RepID=A0AAF0F618_9BASI|nr:endodeoxyribonuclease [Malassezia japonica]WFD38993.1 endodeoxyribonuclease [Malassezia japonica]